MSSGTQARGRGDTWWSESGPGPRRVFWRTVLASVLVHAFLTPFPALWGIVAMLPALQIPDGAEVEIIEIDAIPLAPAAPEPRKAKPPVPVPSPAASPKQPEPEPEVVEPEAPAAPEPEPEPAPPEPAAPELEEPPLVPSTPFGDPVALAGSAGEIVDSNANVRLQIYADVVREHPIGGQIAELLKMTPQWRDFFGPSGIDPIRDVDRVLIAGPQLRDSSQVVGVVQHRLPRERIDSAFEALVARKGRWVDRKARLARADADRAARLFSAPNDKIVVVAPPQLEKQVRAFDAKTQFPKSDGLVAVSGYVVTPANITKGMAIELPETLKWARLDLRPADEGGADVRVLAEDKDEESASASAALLNMLGPMARFTGLRFQSWKFVVKGSDVEGRIVFNQKQVEALVRLITKELKVLEAQQLRRPPLGPDGSKNERALRELRQPARLPQPPPLVPPSR